jgi:hypothetical protein
MGFVAGWCVEKQSSLRSAWYPLLDKTVGSHIEGCGLEIKLSWNKGLDLAGDESVLDEHYSTQAGHCEISFGSRRHT